MFLKQDWLCTLYGIFEAKLETSPSAVSQGTCTVYGNSLSQAPDPEWASPKAPPPHWESSFGKDTVQGLSRGEKRQRQLYLQPRHHWSPAHTQPFLPIPYSQVHTRPVIHILTHLFTL